MKQMENGNGYIIENKNEAFSDQGFGGEDTLPIVIGAGDDGSPVIQDFADISHYVICGYSGSGKTSFVQTIMMKMALEHTPEEVRFLVYDSKATDYMNFNKLPFLYVPVCSDEKKFVGALEWAVVEARKRFRAFAELNAKNLEAYNRKAEERLPHVFIIMDDFFSLLYRYPEEVADSMQYNLNNGRQAGIHFLIVTSTSSPKVLQRELMANAPGRICFAVSSKAESRLVLNRNGAEDLAVPGEMIFRTLNRVARCRAAHMTEGEIDDAIAKRVEQYHIEDPEIASGEEKKQRSVLGTAEADDSYDELLPQAVDIVLDMNSCSVSMLQRNLKLGYARAANIVDQMEALGIVGPYDGGNPRAVIISRSGWSRLSNQLSFSKNQADADFYEVLAGDNLSDGIITEDDEDSEDEIELRPFPNTTVTGGSFFVLNNRIYLINQRNGRPGGEQQKLHFDGGAIDAILCKRPRLFKNGYFQFLFVDEVGIENKKSESLDVDHDSVSNITRIEFVRDEAPAVRSFLRQVADDCGLDITYI